MSYGAIVGPFSKIRGVLSFAHPSCLNRGISDGFRGFKKGLNLKKPQFLVRKINFSEFKHNVCGQSWSILRPI